MEFWYRIIRLIDNDLLFPCRESFRFLTCSSQPISWKMANKQNGRININLIKAILLLHFLEEESNVTLNFLFHLFYHSGITHRFVHLTITNRHRIFDGLLPWFYFEIFVQYESILIFFGRFKVTVNSLNSVTWMVYFKTAQIIILYMLMSSKRCVIKYHLDLFFLFYLELQPIWTQVLFDRRVSMYCIIWSAHENRHPM